MKNLILTGDDKMDFKLVDLHIDFNYFQVVLTEISLILHIEVMFLG
jgi:hypothetical protein